MRTDATTQEYLDKHFQDHPQLVSFQIELTSRCNERCIHCYIPNAHKSRTAAVSDITPDVTAAFRGV
jgi:MoaA/NifB/PqqE/SkfB family radical SAM enzyme